MAVEFDFRNGTVIDKVLVERGREQIVKLQKITSFLSRAVTQIEITDGLLKFLIDVLPCERLVLALKSINDSKFEMSQISKTSPIKCTTKKELEKESCFLISMIKQKRLISREKLVIPLIFQCRTLGSLSIEVFDFFSFSKEEHLFLDAILQQANQALERARLFESELTLRLNAENAQQRFKFLSEASMILSENLNHEKVLKKIVAHTVPRFSDGCVVDLLRDDKLFRIAAAHLDPKKENILHELAWDASLKIRPPMDLVLDKGRPILMSDMNELYFHIESRGRSSESVRSLGLKSIIFIPLGPKEKPIGAMGFVTSETERIFDQADVSLAEEIGRRASVAIENANLFEQVKKAVNLRDEFLSIASHELKTPLTSICLQLELVKRTEDLLLETNPRLLKAFEVLNVQSERLARLIDNLLDLTLIQSGQLSLKLERVDLNDLINRAIATLSASHCAPVLEVESGVVGVWDRSRLEQVIVNLISNGIKYGGEKPLHIKVSTTGEKAVFSVRDFGMGISEKDQKIIFDRFQRANGAYKAWGMGLGLYIARQIVEAHHGSISVQSEPNKGSTFIVEIPLPALDHLGTLARPPDIQAPMVLH